MIAWTEDFDSFTIGASGAWTNYDIYTNKGVPKGAIAEIIVANADKGLEREAGVRKDGSGLARIVDIHESEDNASAAYTFCRQMVYVDASTGLIECYAEDAADITYFLTGWWTGLAWTETWITKTFVKGDDGLWKDWTLFDTNAVPKGSVCHVIGTSNATGASDSLGVRTNGSGLTRSAPVTEAESGGVTTFAMFVKTNATDGIIEAFCTAYGNDSYYVDGYFDSTMDYAELAFAFTAHIGTGVWTDWDLTASLDQDGRVCDLLIGNHAIATTDTHGFRINGSGLTRSILANEGEDDYDEWLSLTTQTDSNGIIESYSTNASGYTYCAGYFKFTTAATYTKTFTFDANLIKGLTKQFTFDACLIKGLTKTFTFDGWNTLQGSKQFTYDGNLQKSLTKPFTYDGNLQKSQTKPFTFDGYPYVAGTKTFTLDGLLLKNLTKPFTFDGSLFLIGTKAYTLDALLQKGLTIIFTVDGLIYVAGTKAFTYDANLQKNLTKDFTYDGQLRKGLTKEFTYDGQTYVLGTVPLTFDSYLQKSLSKAFTYDGQIYVAGTKPFTYDGQLLKSLAKTFTYDGEIYAVGTKPFNYDAELQKELTKTFTYDSWLQKTGTAPFTSDGLLLKAGTKPYTFDAWLLATTGNKHFTYDAVLESALATYTKTFTFDGLLQKSLTKTLTFDGFLESGVTTGTKQFTFDGVLEVAVVTVPTGGGGVIKYEQVLIPYFKRFNKIWVLQPVTVKPFTKKWVFAPKMLLHQHTETVLNPPDMMSFGDREFKVEYNEKLEKLKKEAKEKRK